MKAGALVAAFTRRRGVIAEPGWGTGNLVLKLGAKIFAIVGEDRLVVKLPKARVDELVEAKLGKRFDPRKNGRVMKEWLVVGARADKPELVEEALAFVRKASASPSRANLSFARVTEKRARTADPGSRRTRPARSVSTRTRATRSRPSRRATDRSRAGSGTACDRSSRRS